MDDTNIDTDVHVSKTGAVIAAVIMLVILFFIFCFRVVGVGQEGLINQFGKVTREAQSGVVIKAPYPIQHLVKLNVQVQKEQTDASASTSDLQDVTTTLAVNYHIDPNHVKDLYTNVGTDYKNRLVDPAIQEAFKATSAQYTATQLLTERPAVKEKALEILRTRLASRNIVVDDISIVNFKFSSDFTAAIEAKQVAAQQAEQAKYNADKAANDAQAAINTAKGQAEAQRLIQTTVTAETLQKEAIAKWNGVLPTTMAGGSTVFNIPLSK